MAYNVVPPLTVQQRLFADRWWMNGGDLVEAVEFAGYKGVPSPADKVKRGRQLLASKPMCAYLDYLREKAKADRRTQQEILARGLKGRDLLTEVPQTGLREKGGLGESDRPGGGQNGAIDGRPGEVLCKLEGAAEGVAGVNEGVAGVNDGVAGVNDGFLRPGGPRSHEALELASGTILPPSTPEQAYGRELQPHEVRELLASIARGNENGMRDARSRLRAIELAMRNMGMLVDLSLSAKADLSPEAKALSSKERAAEIARLEEYLAKVKAGKVVKAPTSE